MGQTLTKTPKQRTIVPEVLIAQEATPEDEWTALDWQARRYLGMSGIDFLRRWLAGDWVEDPDQPGVLECAACVPLAEQYAREHGLL